LPKYTKADIRHTIRNEEFEEIMRHTLPLRDRLFLSLIYCTGGRPSEIAGDPSRNIKGMSWGDIQVNLDKGIILFYVPISKIQKGNYAVDKRKLSLEFDLEKPEMAIRVILDAFERVLKKAERDKTFNPDIPIFNMCRKTGYNIVKRAGRIIGVPLCPYNFRHSRLTQLAEQGAGIETLMYFKGSKDVKSISTYLHAKDIKFSLSKKPE